MDTESFDKVAEQIPLYREALLQVGADIKDQAWDIRASLGQPLGVWGRDGPCFVGPGGAVSRAPGNSLPAVGREDLDQLFFQICGQSVYSHEEELRQGYVSLEGGCRAGVCGTAVVEGGKVKSLRDVTSLVFRIPREQLGCADCLFLAGVDFSAGVLLVGEPGSGKTTLLRDAVRSLSWGKFSPCRRVAVLDQRGELGAFGLGPGADLLRGYPRAAGMETALRCLSPEFLVCDELGEEDLPTVSRYAFAGAGLLATLHGGEEDLLRRPLAKALLETGAFQTVACLQGRQRPGQLGALFRVETQGQGKVLLTRWET